MLELKPCPFCGGEAKLIEGSYSEDGRFDRAWIVYCRYAWKNYDFDDDCAYFETKSCGL